MKIAVVGSRDFPKLWLVREFVRAMTRRDLLISGGARGVDITAEITAVRRRVSRLIYEPKCEEGEPGYVAALHARNALIVKACERAVVFWDGTSPGTKSVIELLEKSRKAFEVRRDG